MSREREDLVELITRQVMEALRRGGAPRPSRAVTAMAVNSFTPSLTAFHTALRSAQIVSPYEAFSMLQPW